MRLLYLPAYSPDFNPIEEGFSAMKAWLRRNRDYSLSCLPSGLPASMDPFYLLWDAVYKTMTPSSIRGWYLDCGYVI
ncbi:hypothetical protein FIBSPDRAFT_750587 [Athelia psychrophila]|uniref:Tc1-like transposase DDE domain-containing protein n=1 Tax=Athelia psychrophila TaxID=1759441 RepID=A0A166DZH0_9AGAM|nr:hypothetical protein FIBSPDRAFT_750587 [Fibularhizoctonia sp. CBS 109695]